LSRFDIVRLSARDAPGGQPMRTTKRFQPDASKLIDCLKRRFDKWRKFRKPRSRIPERLWKAAIQTAQQCGLNRTAKALHLDYYTLKQRIEASSGIQESAPAFIELSPADSGATPECVIELENRNGSKMRIQIKGMGAPDLNALSSAFWRGKR
jgi:hypothetical protein